MCTNNVILFTIHVYTHQVDDLLQCDIFNINVKLKIVGIFNNCI